MLGLAAAPEIAMAVPRAIPFFEVIRVRDFSMRPSSVLE